MPARIHHRDFNPLYVFFRGFSSVLQRLWLSAVWWCQRARCDISMSRPNWNFPHCAGWHMPYMWSADFTSGLCVRVCARVLHSEDAATSVSSSTAAAGSDASPLCHHSLPPPFCYPSFASSSPNSVLHFPPTVSFCYWVPCYTPGCFYFLP